MTTQTALTLGLTLLVGLFLGACVVTIQERRARRRQQQRQLRHARRLFADAIDRARAEEAARDAAIERTVAEFRAELEAEL